MQFTGPSIKLELKNFEDLSMKMPVGMIMMLVAG
jgi:hypothetical protein